MDTHQHVATGPAEYGVTQQAWVLVLLCLVAFHFTTTALYVSPPNPLKIKLINPLHAYMDPIFGQAWTLFAPNPLAHSSHLATVCKWREGDSEVESEPTEVSSGWFDKARSHVVGPAR